MSISKLTQQAENLVFNIGQKAPHKQLHAEALSLLKGLYLAEQQPHSNKEKLITTDEKKLLETQKAERKIPLWINNPASIPSNILSIYLNERRHRGAKATITQEILEDVCFNKLKVVKFDRETFKRNFAQMKNFADKNHAKIFDEGDDGNITIWPPVEKHVRNFYESVLGCGDWDKLMKNAYPNYRTLKETKI